MNKRFLQSISMLAGTVIGAGIFSLPYLFNQLGVLVSFLFLLFFSLVYFVIHLMYAGLIRRERSDHRFSYLARKYLPRSVSWFASFSVIGGLVLSLAVYLILAPSFFEIAFGFGGALAAIVFWLFGSFFMFLRLEWVGWGEILGIFSILIIVGAVFSVGGWSFSEVGITGDYNLGLLLLPFGPLLFAFSGRSAVPKVVDEYVMAKKEKNPFSIRRALLWGSAVPVAVYLIFIVGILRLGGNVAPEALTSLEFVSPAVMMLLGVLGILTLWTSYFMVGINVREIMSVDMQLPWTSGMSVAVLGPLLLYFLVFDNFLTAIVFTGGVFLGLEGVFVITMWRRASTRSPWRKWSVFLYPVFLIALGYAVISFIIF